MVVYPARSGGRGFDVDSRRQRTVVMDERPRRPAHPNRRRSREGRSPSRGRSPRSPGRPYRDERERRLPPGFSRRCRTTSPPPPPPAPPPAHYNRELDRNRLIEGVPLLPGGVDLPPVGHGGTYGAVIPDADEKAAGALPPHMKHSRGSVRPGNEIVHFDGLNPPHHNLRGPDDRMDERLPLQNPLMVSQMPIQNTNLLALDKPKLMPQMMDLPKNPLAMGSSQIGLSRSGLVSHAILPPHRDSPPPRMRPRDSPVRDARRRSATPVLDVSVLSNGGEGAMGKPPSRHGGQTGKKDEGRMFMKDARPKKKQKQSKGRHGQGARMERERNEWVRVDDEMSGVQLHLGADVNPPASMKNPPITSSLSQSRPVSSDQYIAELRLLLAERMHQALETAASKGHGECGILEESVGIDYDGRFGRMLNVVEAGFPTVREMIRSTCLDIVQMQQLRAGEVVKMGYIPTPSIKAEAGMVLAGVREAYSKLVAGSGAASQGNQMTEARIVEVQKPPVGGSAPAAQMQKPPPFMLAKMAKNMLRSIMRDIVSEVWPSVTIPQFLEKFRSHYSLNLEAKDLGYASIKNFLSSQVESIVAFQEVDGETHLVPSVKYLTEKPPVLAGLHGKKVVFLGSGNGSGQYRGAGGSGNLGQSNTSVSAYHAGVQKTGSEANTAQQPLNKTSSGLTTDGRYRGGMSRPEEDKLSHLGSGTLLLPSLTRERNATIEGPAINPQSSATEMASLGSEDKQGGRAPARPGHPREMYESSLVGGSFPQSSIPSKGPASVAASSQSMSAPKPKEYSRLVLAEKAVTGPSHVESLPQVLTKLSDLVKKHVVDSGTPVLLNRLPLLYFNEYRHVLDFMTLGFAALGDLVGLLAEVVTVAESPSGKVLVPANAPSSVIWPPSSQPTEVAGAMQAGHLPKSAPHITLPSHSHPSPPLPSQMEMPMIQHPESDASNSMKHGGQQAHNSATAPPQHHAPLYQYPPPHQMAYGAHGAPASSQPVYTNWNSPSTSEPAPHTSAPAAVPGAQGSTDTSYADAYYQYQQQYQQYEQHQAHHYPQHYQHYQPQESLNQHQQQQQPRQQYSEEQQRHPRQQQYSVEQHHQSQQQYSVEHGRGHSGHVYGGPESHAQESQQPPPVPTGAQNMTGAQQWEAWNQYSQGGQNQHPVPHGAHPSRSDGYWHPQ
ncbi:hypothetical protein BSKO_02141 [Bryopsis sp. KO-2023]|nr:hypothetical protein BSKO_02141 [Bryopsis sp. KO-2023]